MATTIEVDFEVLDRAAGCIEDRAESFQGVCQRIDACMQQTYQKGWMGEAADAFFNEMNDAVLPRMERLLNAFWQTRETLLAIKRTFEQAEDDAANEVSQGPGDAGQPKQAPAVPAPKAVPGGLKHTVVPGDTLWDLAQRHGTSVDAILAANPGIVDRNLIYPGQVLNIPGAEAKPSPVPTPAPKPAPDLGASGRTPQVLNQKIDSFNVASNPRYVAYHDGNPRTNDTYCNLYASDVAQSMGAPLPIFLDLPGGRKWLGATYMTDWLNGNLTSKIPGNYAQGPDAGWMKVDHTTAAQAANQGYVTVAAGHGHMAVVRAGNPAGVSKADLMISQAGARNFNSGSLASGWGQYMGEVNFYVFKGG